MSATSRKASRGRRSRRCRWVDHHSSAPETSVVGQGLVVGADGAVAVMDRHAQGHQQQQPEKDDDQAERIEHRRVAAHHPHCSGRDGRQGRNRLFIICARSTG